MATGTVGRVTCDSPTGQSRSRQQRRKATAAAAAAAATVKADINFNFLTDRSNWCSAAREARSVQFSRRR